LPKFKYKAKLADSDAAKIGYLEAPDAQSAQKYLDKKGFQTEWIRPAGRSKRQTDSSADLVFESRRKRTVYGKEHDVGQYRPSFSDFIQDHKPPKRVVGLILGLCSLLGVLVTFATWGRPAQAGERKSNQPVRYKVQVLGKVGSPSMTDGLIMTLSIPDIPYQQTWKGKEALDDSGQIKTELEFLTRRPAGYCDVELSLPGQETIRKPRLSLSGFDSTIDLGTLSFRPTESSR
jgi:hypothetical protein